MTPRAYVVACCLFLAIRPACSQHLAAYLDYMDRFYVFDAGTEKRLEHYKITSFKVGGDCVMYVDYSSNLKVYQDGRVRLLEETAPTSYEVSDYLAVWSVYNVLKAFEDGKELVLCSNVGRYVAEDSLVVFYDVQQKELKAFRNETTETLEDGLIEWPLASWSSGDNVFAYITTFENKFKIYYRGQLHVVDDFVKETVYKAGRDVVAYTNQPANAFIAFYKGDFYILDPFVPRSFQVGDGMVAFVDYNGGFKIFEGGELKLISSFTPDFYELTDSTLVYGEDGFLKSWCGGRSHEIEHYIPELYRISERTVAYIDVNRRVRAFRKCEKINISLEPVNNLEMFRNLIVFNIGINTTRIWYEGRIYDVSARDGASK